MAENGDRNEMTTDLNKLEAETNQVIVALAAIVSVKTVAGFERVNFSLAACEAAAAITGCDVTFCKMLNRQFRDAAAAMVFARAA